MTFCFRRFLLQTMREVAANKFGDEINIWRGIGRRRTRRGRNGRRKRRSGRKRRKRKRTESTK